MLIGAALNSVLDEMFPTPARVRAREHPGVYRGATPMAAPSGGSAPASAPLVEPAENQGDSAA